MNWVYHLADTPERIIESKFVNLPAPWIIFLIGALILAFAAMVYLLEPKGRRGGLKFALALLRALAIGLVVAILFRPVSQSIEREVREGLVVVAVDTSRSMSFEDREKDDELNQKIANALSLTREQLRDTDRLDRVRKALRRDSGQFLKDLAANNQVKLYTFSAGRKAQGVLAKARDDESPEELQARVTEVLAGLEDVEADGQATAVGDSLQRILTDVRSERVAGVVLFTDGRNTAGRLSSAAVAGRFGRKGVPIYAVGVGDPEPPRDLSIDDFRAPDVALAEDVLRVSLVVRAQGYKEQREAKVTLKLDDLVIEEKTGLVGGDRLEWEVDFSTRIARPGEYTLEAKIAPDPTELTHDNNRALRRVRVIDERIKVLYVEGYPRWEYRFLKNGLVRDKHMEVQGLLVSADPNWAQPVTEGVEEIRRLPSAEELREFHVIILGDVGPESRFAANGEPVFYNGALEAIKTAVKEDGAGLFMISGTQSNPRAFANTPLADVLPIVIDESNARDDFSRPYVLRLTREGRDSPLLRLEEAEARNREFWDSRAPSFFMFTRSERVKPQAHVLAVHPTARNGEGLFPLMAWQRYGAGTALWYGFDEGWRFRAEVGDKYHYKLYSQAIRFLSLQSFTRAKRFFVTTDKTKYDVGEEVRIRAEIRDEDALRGRTKQEVELEHPDGETQIVTLQKDDTEPGKFTGVYTPVKIGPYRLSINPGEFGGEHEVASRVFEVKLPRLELQDPRMDKEGLEKIAAASGGGRFVRLHEIYDLPEQVLPQTEERTRNRDEEELWDNKWMFMILCVVLILEWLGRKLCRLL
ncbi:MAG: VWA domain-containing protein [Planctomycetes bacterium]|nr:VWA domain-containing protein [Planctomycetota bacterium]